MNEEKLMEKIAENMFDNLPDLPEKPTEPIEFSEEHCERMKKLFEKPKSVIVFYRFPKRILIAILAVIIVIAVPLSVKAVREPIFRFFAQVFGGERTELFSSEEDRRNATDEKIETYFNLYYIPYGFELVSSEKTDTRSFFEYSNGSDSFSFEQKRVKEGKPDIPKNAEDIDEEYAESPWEITYFKLDGKNVFLWIFGYNEFRLTADATIPLETLKRIADDALDEITFEERKVLESSNASGEDPYAPEKQSAETLPSEFRFKLPKGLTVRYWQDYSFPEDTPDYQIFIASENREYAMHIQMFDVSIAFKATVNDTGHEVRVGDITVNCFENVHVYIWQDNDFTYDVSVDDYNISTEVILDMIRDLYN